MATPNKDAAKEVYTPDHRTRTQSSVDSVPALATDGVDCSGFNVLAVRRSLVGATSVDFTLYYYDNSGDNNGWFPVEVSTDLALADYDPTQNEYFQQYNIAGVYRYKFVLDTVVGGTVRVTENLSI
jgi:hypothetical protein